MHFVTTWTFTPERRDSTVERFLETGGMPPDGVTMLSRWHDVAGGRGYAICEADDAAPIAKWCRQWSDLLEFEVVPVVDDATLGAILAG